MIPHDSAYAITLTTKVEDFISVIFLPAYFAVSGLRTQVRFLVGLAVSVSTATPYRRSQRCFPNINGFYKAPVAHLKVIISVQKG